MTQKRAGLDAVHERMTAYLESVDDGTPTSVVGSLFAIQFANDAEVCQRALTRLAQDLWPLVHRRGGASRRDRGAVPRTMEVKRADGSTFERVVQVRIDWNDITELADMDALIAERVRTRDGASATVKDLRAVRRAMVAFPGVRAEEAARLAGVNLAVLHLRTGTDG